ncbi:flagellar protein FlaG [Marinobacter adhaerens]|uniref:Flagellar protein FlaG n=1 Tax=Marinobacter adhaerens TaxID=1033846 RepID=A0A851HSP9_9GAMM|nr:flagellar protein FlaG [Marinobacter adhaerens]NWN91760.1 flagellar protein FlaG [Marinobacter adhaerens]
MNDVNLNNPALKLVRTSEQAPVARAMSSSVAEADSASDLAASVAGNRQADNTHAREASETTKAQTVVKEPQEALGEAVSQLNDYVQNVQRDLQFEVDSDLGQTVVKVVDQETQEVIRQIPDEVALRLAEKLQQDEPLTLFNIKV